MTPIDSVFSIGMGLSLLKPQSRSIGSAQSATCTERVVLALSRSIRPVRRASCTGRVVRWGCVGRLSDG